MMRRLILIGLAAAIASTMMSQEKLSQRASSLQTLTNLWLGNQILDVPVKCGLPALAYASQHRATLDEQQLQSRLNILSRPSAQKSILVGSFRIHYDTTGANEPAILDNAGNRIPNSANRYADSVGAIANYALRFERDSLGYLPPPNDNGQGGGPEYDIYVQNLGGSFYGLTTPEDPINPSQRTATTFMEVHNDFTFVRPDSNKGLPALRVTLAHELHHAIQIGNYGYWDSDVYFHEITSVWMEDAMFTGVNDYYQYLRSSAGHFRNPEVPFAVNDFIAYSRGIWGNFIAKRFGARVIRRAWEFVRSVRPLEAMDNALQESGSGMRQAFAEWTVWNFYTGIRSDSIRYYPEGRFYPLISERPKGFTPPSRRLDDSLQAFSARYYFVVGGADTLKLITSNINLPAAIAGADRSFPYAYLLNINRLDDTYLATTSRIFVKFEVQDRVNWAFVVDTTSAKIEFPPPTTTPFRNPFHADGVSTIAFPITSFGMTDGTLTILSASMDLVYQTTTSSSNEPKIGQQVFRWDGRNENGKLSASGVYFYFINLPGGLVKGKFALIRK